MYEVNVFAYLIQSNKTLEYTETLEEFLVTYVRTTRKYISGKIA
jgi:hypothetical protein